MYTKTYNDGMKEYSIKDARANISAIIEQVYKNEESVVLTKFGKPKVMITPVSEDVSRVTREHAIKQSHGLWKDRVIKRKQTRHEKIFS